ncbi:hypothetical protein PGN35_005175 [Nodosilinea sp. PGN35]|uniref:hypothetical protein n=1 Tax=Nodosilinea sp. PGN35 TaxID=3020489 RepID=UPI0023B32F78|nr:hypothetical protein [Nodosilinea sp. TSF1-S3]MDF0367629.1 hypothetical protein [Nodosilinea sp. TSF1-S3]
MEPVLRSRRTHRLMVALHWALAALPLFLLAGLGGMTARATQLLGSFPHQDAYQYPFAQSDRLYQGWIWFANQFFLLTILSWIPWLCLIVFSVWWQRRCWSGRTALGWVFPAAVYGLCHLIICFEPTNRIGWFLD